MGIEELDIIRSETGTPKAEGLADKIITSGITKFPELEACIREVKTVWQKLSPDYKAILKSSEEEIIDRVYIDYLPLYLKEDLSPFVPLHAKGPWIISAYGRVFYDAGGYGMLGFGHNPDFILDTFKTTAVMANIKTPSLEQVEFVRVLKSRIGRERECPYVKFACLNSGSEGITLALRTADCWAKEVIDSSKKSFKDVRIISLEGSFHGRTDMPARVSGSTFNRYKDNLYSFKDWNKTLFVKPNDVKNLENTFKRALEEGYFVQCVILEPVMGEGNPGLALNREFYKKARELTAEHNSLLIIDSVQACFRGKGELSIVDYPDFRDLEPPDIEVYSKALNAGHYPLSVIAFSDRGGNAFKSGVYGNTMTANPRALRCAMAVLSAFTDDISKNVVRMGSYFLDRCIELKRKFPDKVRDVMGSGLLFGVELRDEYRVTGAGGVEDLLRRAGVNVIHGGKNTIRFTPWFKVNEEEADLIIDIVEATLSKI